jgi:hypothetical protein
MWFGHQSRGKLWDCVGIWYTGEWRQGYAGYVSSVRKYLRNRPWRRWAG